ncbi:unnamed protein product [Miscanthus lutarioriparius]|uniref:Uncharacterized protein n=1 Tax=Miscanthus lutarioriparius TaxID=422564 RepID=A0A811QDX2_9POAL|nr:unnamed protein product [Miscanthus lutarioriparius]
MEPRRLERLVFLLCCIAAITCRLHAQAQAQTTLQHTKSSTHTGAVGRNLSELGNRSESVLSRRTRRVDPLEGLRKYEEGRSGYVMSGLWIIGGIIFVVVLLVSKIFFPKKKERYTDFDYFLERYQILTVILCILLTVFVIVSSAVALRGTVQFHSRAESVKEIIGTTALEATATIFNITGAIEKMQNTSKLYNYTSQAWDHLNSTVEALNSEAVEIQAKAEKNMRLVSKGIRILELVTILCVTLNLVALLVLLVGRPLRLQKLCCLCMAFCWILTALFWMYFGLYYFFDKFAGDTCVALDEYQLNPQNSTLGTIIPCSEKLSADVILHDVGAGIHDIIDQYQYRAENCPSGAATIGDIPQVNTTVATVSDSRTNVYVWSIVADLDMALPAVVKILKRLTCSDFGGGANCRPADLSSAIDYDKVQSYTSSIQNVLDIFPGTERLVSCELVKAGFADIVGNQCAPLRRGARAAWAALAALSASMVLLILLVLVATNARHPGDDRLSVRHLTSSTNSEISEVEFAEMHAKKVRIRVGP